MQMWYRRLRDVCVLSEEAVHESFGTKVSGLKLNSWRAQVCTITPSGSRTRDAGVGGERSTKEAKGYSL